MAEGDGEEIFNAVHTVEAKEPCNTVRSYGLRSARKSKKVHGLAPEAGTRTTRVFSLGAPAAPLSLRQFQEKFEKTKLLKFLSDSGVTIRMMEGRRNREGKKVGRKIRFRVAASSGRLASEPLAQTQKGQVRDRICGDD
ncbi:hypothetical protein K0M31_007310 [Melipona bicolor]|uniref:Uncharacterized protein n=1 Tax=Melipona bicolor TaxID=60889 RepID=A0AA40GB60_9HYME|nr:hypothetical protein K0M31_007310 [Melipona bicolor]